ncbi:hypothetical protein M3G00_01745 [Brevibacterium casei]|nr:hypothetical protein [Brevibacterium casei]MCT2181654.1 hypothetical protein [Brevibacterium casei]NJE65816.1 hypothetical protein [Brevibacterium sp. LS14]QQT69969.1 hypothetical protein I6I57_03330 [Brevibacterium casei]QZE25791.1 hypothetical protein K4X33_00055 [Brevibacterium casei]
MSDPHRPIDQRPRRAMQGTGALGPGTGSNDPQLRLRVTRRAEPDMRRLVEWVLNMTQARYDAHRAGEPDPYDLPPPDELAADSLGPVSDARGKVEPEQSNERSIA